MEGSARAYASIIFPDAAAGPDPQLSVLRKTMLDATPDCIKLLSPEGRVLTMNKAGCLALGVPENTEFGMAWLPLLPEAVHPLGLEALRKAAAGENARFPGQSATDDGVRYWDNLLTPLVDAAGAVFSILCVSRDVTPKTLLEMDLENAIERERLLSQEPRHRIKNLFSVVSGLISIAETEAARNGEPRAATTVLRQKLGALARASEATFALSDVETGGGGEIDLESVVTSVLEPYGGQCRTSGDPASICRDNMTTVALFFHELATNSVKYGALGSRDGEIAVNWTAGEQGLRLTWVERGGPSISTPPVSQGFGSQMAERIVRSVGGRIERKWRDEGLTAELSLPSTILNRAARPPV